LQCRDGNPRLLAREAGDFADRPMGTVAAVGRGTMRLVVLLLASLAACTHAAPDGLDVEGPDDDGSETDADAVTDTNVAPILGTKFTIGGVPGWVHFTNPPAHAGQDTNIIREAVRLIDATPPGETIHAAIHSLVLNNVVAALIAAQQRGVTVRVAEDGSDEFDADDSPRQLAAALGADQAASRPIRAASCTRS
jgi:hypothetical protein